MDIRCVIADADGTLISKGDINSVPSDLKDSIRTARKNGILFSTISGRDREFLIKLHKEIIGNSNTHLGEALLYEDVCIHLFPDKQYRFGGLDESVISSVSNLSKEKPDMFRGLVPLPDNKFTIRTSWVTEEFASGKPTNTETLTSRYKPIKKMIESTFSGCEVHRSSDAIDVVGKGANKTVSLNEYFGILDQLKGIKPYQVLALGDSFNDEGMLNLISGRGGKIGFVGTDKELEKRIGALSGSYIPNKKGPEGTAEVIRAYLNH